MEVRLPEDLLEDACFADGDFFPLATFLEADLDDLAADFVDFLAAVFFAAVLPLGAGVAAHTDNAALNARTITIATERKRLVPKT